MARIDTIGVTEHRLGKGQLLSGRLLPGLLETRLIWIGLLLFIGLFAAMVGWLWPQHPLDPYAGLRQLLSGSGIHARARFDGLYNDLTRLETLPGWELTRVSLAGSDTLVALTRSHGSVAQLKNWAAQNGFVQRVDKSSVVLLAHTPGTRVLDQAVLMSVDDVTGYLTDALYKFLPDMDLVVGEETLHGVYWQRNINIILKNHTRHDLVDLGTIFDGLPVCFVDGELTTTDGLLMGELHFTIVGE